MVLQAQIKYQKGKLPQIVSPKSPFKNWAYTYQGRKYIQIPCPIYITGKITSDNVSIIVNNTVNPLSRERIDWPCVYSNAFTCTIDYFCY